jgi:hypothetical protein
MTIVEALNNTNINGLRLSYGHRWLVGQMCSGFIVYERLPYARRITEIWYSSEEEAVEALLREEE